MGLREITDTHSLEDALGKALDKLETLDDPEARAVVERGSTLHRMMKSWEYHKPDPGSKYETIGAVLQLLASAAGLLERAGQSIPPSSGQKPQPPRPRSRDRQVEDSRREPTDPPPQRTSEPPDSLDDPFGDALLEAPNDILHLALMAWEEPAPGVYVKRIGTDATTVDYCRLAAGVSLLPAAENDVIIHVLDGMLRVHDDTVSGGMAIQVRAPVPTLYAVGESTFLLIGGSLV